MRTRAHPQHRGRESALRNAAARVVRWLCLTVVFLLVAGLGIGVAGSGSDEPTFTEQAQLDAASRARALAADARALASNPQAPAAGFEQAAVLLEAQAAALSPAGGSPSGDTASPGPSAAPSAAPVTAESLAGALAASAGKGLADASRSEPGIARLLAATAGSQRWQAAVLRARLGLPALPPAAPLPGPPEAGAGTECAGSALGSAEDRRYLLAAAKAEHRAVYAYEVAAARLPDAGPSLRAARAHAAGAAAAGAFLEVLCAPVPAVVPAYALDPAFSADPAAGIARLEGELCVLYGDLVGLGGEDIRAWAVPRFNAAIQRSLAASGGAEPVPCVPTEAAAQEPGSPATGTTKTKDEETQ